MEEYQAVALIKSGDLRGLEFLVHRYQGKAVQAAFMIVNDRSSAEEIVQSAFIRAVEKIHQFDSKRPFGPWFFRIVINASLMTCQRSNRQIPLEGDDVSEHLPQWLVDPSQTLEELTETTETRRAVWESINSLSSRQRAVVVMRYYLDMKDREISQVLRQPLSTTKWTLHRAKGRLHDLLQSLFSSRANDSTEPTSAHRKDRR